MDIPASLAVQFHKVTAHYFLWAQQTMGSRPDLKQTRWGGLLFATIATLQISGQVKKR
jgi:hypothetical protein